MNDSNSERRSGRVHPAGGDSHQFQATDLAINHVELTDPQRQCRICIEAGGLLVRPCRCAGSAAFVHYQCLKMWIEKRSEDKDGIVRHFERVDCEMCKYKFIFHTRTKEKFSCEEYSRIDTCRGDVVMELFFIGFFVIGAIVSSILLARGINNDLTYPPEGLKFSISTICFMLALPVSLAFVGVFVRTFIRNFCIRRQRVIISIDEYQGTERQLQHAQPTQ